MNVRLPRGVVHTDQACYHVRGKAVATRLLAPAWDEGCRDCRKRLERRIAAARAAHTAAVVAAARRDVIERPDAVIEYLLARGRTG